MSIDICTSLIQQFDNSGNVLNGGSVTVYAANTTTPLTLYSDTGLSTTRLNPITLDSAGRHAICYIAAGTSYKIVVKNSGGSVLYTRDNIDPGVAVGSGALPIASGGTGATSAGAARTNLDVPANSVTTAIAGDVATLQTRLGSTGATALAKGTTAQRPGSPATDNIRYNTDLSQYEVYDGANWKRVLIAAGVLATDLPAGTMVQVVGATYASNADLTGTIPADDTIPQITEGVQVTTLNITPQSATNKVLLRFNGHLTSNGAQAFAVALYRAGTASAIQVHAVSVATSDVQYPVSLEFLDSPASASQQTYSIRIGSGGGGTCRFNGTTTTRQYGGAAAATLIATEVVA